MQATLYHGASPCPKTRFGVFVCIQPGLYHKNRGYSIRKARTHQRCARSNAMTEYRAGNRTRGYTSEREIFLGRRLSGQ